MAFDLNLNYNFNDIIYSLQSMGVYDVFLPFLLTFAIFFAILEKTRIFGSEGQRRDGEGKIIDVGMPRRNINALVAMVVGLLLVAQRPIVDVINMFLPRVALIIVVLLMFLLLVSMLTKDTPIHFEGFALGIFIIIIIVSLFIALSPTFDIDSNTRDSILRIIIPLGVLFGVYKLVTGSSTSNRNRHDAISRLGYSPHYPGYVPPPPPQQS